MTRVALLDAWSGVAGDMWVGALLGCGVRLDVLEAAVASLGLPGVSLRREEVLRAGMAGVRFQVLEHGEPADAPGPVLTPLAEGAHRGARGAAVPDHEHRRLGDIEAIVRRGDLPDPVREKCLAVYRAIAEVEAEAHGQPIESVHFHEVGGVDTIVDVVCACLGTHLLGVDRIVANGIAVGSGTVRTAHGVLPVPAPATAALLRGVPVRHGGLEGERTTPTGAALLRTLVDGFDESITIRAEEIGYGAGTRDDPKIPNLLRMTLGDVVDPGAEAELAELNCHLDTASGELVGWLIDEALRRGATDAFAAPIQMKKGRPGLLVTVLCEVGREGAFRDFLLEESTTLGVRSARVRRSVLERWQEERASEFGPVRYKVARLPGGARWARPEDDEVRRLCAEHGLGRAEVLRRLGARES